MTLLIADDDELNAAEGLLRTRQLADALEGFDRAEAVGADADRCSAGRWQAHMLLGDFESAWRESDGIRARGAPDAHRFWQGEAIEGKRVMVRCLHGLGDAVQFLRYLPRLSVCAERVIVEVPPAFVDLAKCFDGVGQVITWGKDAPEIEPEWDVQIEVVELPYVFRTTLGDLPVACNYVHLPGVEDAKVHAGNDVKGRFKIGVVWASGEWNTARSVRLDSLAEVLRAFDCELWNLQGGAARAEWMSLDRGDSFHDGDECAGSIVGLAKLIAAMDLVITTDTLAAHLAGALGRNAWVLLEFAADWRWMHERADSPWYGSLRLVRQSSQGDWSSVLEQVRMRLEGIVEGRRYEKDFLHG